MCGLSIFDDCQILKLYVQCTLRIAHLHVQNVPGRIISKLNHCELDRRRRFIWHYLVALILWKSVRKL